jgi:hypothetical protein
MRRAGVVLLAAMAAVATSCGLPMAPLARSAHPMGVVTKTAATVTAGPVRPDPRIGAIFLGGDSLHSCTGSVLHSASGDLVLTAAHCMVGGVEALFVPAFSENAGAPVFWHIDTVYLDPRWVSNQDPVADFAIARVARVGRESVEAAVGGGFAIGPSPRVGTDVLVTGYPLGVGGEPIACAARIAGLERGYPAVRCEGLVDGTSGGPWLAGSAVVGITGGLDGGGCQENVSYAPPFDDALGHLMARAEAGGPADNAPTDYADGC